MSVFINATLISALPARKLSSPDRFNTSDYFSPVSIAPARRTIPERLPAKTNFLRNEAGSIIHAEDVTATSIGLPDDMDGFVIRRNRTVSLDEKSGKMVFTWQEPEKEVVLFGVRFENNAGTPPADEQERYFSDFPLNEAFLAELRQHFPERGKFELAEKRAREFVRFDGDGALMLTRNGNILRSAGKTIVDPVSRPAPVSAPISAPEYSKPSLS